MQKGYYNPYGRLWQKKLVELEKLPRSELAKIAKLGGIHFTGDTRRVTREHFLMVLHEVDKDTLERELEAWARASQADET